MSYFSNVKFPNYYSLQDVYNDTEDVDLFGERIQIITENPLFHTETALNERRNFKITNQKRLRDSEELLRDISDLFFVHYVSSSTTLQGISLRYDCPLNLIKQVNRIFTISHGGNVGVKKLLLIPMMCCGEKIKSLKYAKLSHPDASIQQNFNKSDVLEDVESFYLESFGNHYNADRLINLISDSDFVRKLPCSVVSRLIWRDICSEFKYIPELEKFIKESKNMYVSEFTFIESDQSPTFLVRIPHKIFNVGTFKKSKSTALPTPKSSIENSEFEDKVFYNANFDKLSPKSSLLERIIDALCNNLATSSQKENIECNIELENLESFG